MNDNYGLTEQEVNELFCSLRPKLLKYARSLSIEYFEDLVNTTYLKVILNRDKFQRGTSFSGWCFTILRNAWLSDIRKSKREVQDTDNQFSMNVPVDGYQEESFEIEQLSIIMKSLNKYDRDIMWNLGVLGLTYEEAADKLSITIGTLKSSYSRLKEDIRKELEPESLENNVKEPVSSLELKVLQLHGTGMTVSEIAENTGLKRSEIMKLLT